MNANNIANNIEVIHQSSSSGEPPLSLRNVYITYSSRKGPVQAIRGVDLDLRAGESLSLIGESGSGKTTLGLGIVRLLVKTAQMTQGQIIYRRDNREIDVGKLNDRELREFRWRECSIVFQSALNALNPVLRVWNQFYDTARAHGWHDKNAIHAQVLKLLNFVQLHGERVLQAYPHELSGGMRQRVLIAMVLLL